MNEFYVGYLPKAPSGIARRIRITVIGLIAVVILGAIAFASVQRTFAPAVFEFGRVRSFEGVIEANPYPTLVLTRPGATDGIASRYLLVAEGKHGADDQVSSFIGKKVRLDGTLIYRDAQTMVELVNGSVALRAQPKPNQAAEKSWGVFTLTGEIVDSKCYLGIMNPGSGKVHRDCAARCLSGGVPPLFVTNDFRLSPAVLQLTNMNQKPLAKEAYLGKVGQPIRIQGTVLEMGDTLLVEADPRDITPLP